MGAARTARRRNARRARSRGRKTQSLVLTEAAIPLGSWMEPETAAAIKAGLFILARPLPTKTGATRQQRQKQSRKARLDKIAARHELAAMIGNGKN